jgi:serine/threonine protein kinase
MARMNRQYIGRYRITGQLGAGGMGTVVRAVDEVRQRDVAIKLPNDADPQIISRLQRECDVLAQLEHHHIVQVYGSGSDPDLPFYIVMEYIEGTTVEDLLHQQGGRLEPRQALKITQSVAEALAYAHKAPLRVIHRDIKPSNILIRQQDGAVKVTDFGIAAVLSQRPGATAIGTLAYAAPEQALGKGADERSDLYALGALLYEMLTGQRPPRLAADPARPPSATPGLKEALGDLAARVDQLTLGLLERDPKLRKPQRAAEVVEELREMLEEPATHQGDKAQSSKQPISSYGTRPASAGPAPRLPPPPRSPPQPIIRVAQPVQKGQAGRVVRVVPVVPAVALPRSSGKALASLMLGILALLSACVLVGSVPGLLAAIFGHLALLDIRRSGGRLQGQRLAIAGLILGYVSIGLALLVFFSLRLYDHHIDIFTLVGWKDV